jgi:predicted O-methyltransferase YrrM
MDTLGEQIDAVAHSAGARSAMERVKAVHGGMRLCHHKVRALYALRELAGPSISSYLEIGVHNGASMSYVLLCRSPIVAVGVDLFESSPYKQDGLSKRGVERRLEAINTAGHSMRLIRGDSHADDTFASLADTQFDLIFIDGEHSYEGVASDFRQVSRLLAPSGILAFDDNNDAKRNRGVRNFVGELLADGEYEHYDFCDRLHPGEYSKGLTFIRRRRGETQA